MLWNIWIKPHLWKVFWIATSETKRIILLIIKKQIQWTETKRVFIEMRMLARQNIRREDIQWLNNNEVE